MKEKSRLVDYIAWPVCEQKFSPGYTELDWMNVLPVDWKG